jgi:hypothetical protein
VEEFDSLEATQQPRQQQQQQRLRGPKRLFDNQATPGQARYAQGLPDVVQPRGGPVDGLGKYLDSFFFLSFSRIKNGNAASRQNNLMEPFYSPEFF